MHEIKYMQDYYKETEWLPRDLEREREAIAKSTVWPHLNLPNYICNSATSE